MPDLDTFFAPALTQVIVTVTFPATLPPLPIEVPPVFPPEAEPVTLMSTPFLVGAGVAPVDGFFVAVGLGVGLGVGLRVGLVTGSA